MTVDQQLYLDGVLMDMSDDSTITLDIKSNLFRDITKMTSNTTYTINLPKTAHNMAVLVFAGKPRSSSKYPFVFHSARYFRNGIEIIHSGKASVLSVSDTIEISIYWGLFTALETLQSSDLKLNELNCTKYVKFYKNSPVDTYEDAITNGVFYAYYNTARTKSYSDEWEGSDKVQGGNSSDTYTLVAGKIRTGTEVGEYASGEVIEDSAYQCIFIEFSAGMKASISKVLGKGDYRTWAILDSDKNVLSLADDAGTSEEETMPIIGAQDPILSTLWGAGTLLAEGRTSPAMTTISIRFCLATSAPAGQVEYGVYDPTNGFAEAWGTQDVAEGNGGKEITVEVTKYKEQGKLVYVKPSKDGMLYSILGAGTASNYYVENGTQHITANGVPYSVKYTSESQPISVELQAPATAAWLIINAIKEYSTSDVVTIETQTEAKARSSGASSGGGSYGGGSYGVSTHYGIQPCVTAQYVLDLITAQTKVAFGWSDQAKGIIQGLAIPLINRKADVRTVIGSLAGIFFDTTSIGVLDFQLTSISDAFDNQEKNTRYSQLNVKIACTMVFDVQMYWSWDISEVQPQGHRNWSYNGSTETQAFYTYPPCYIEIKVVSTHSDSQEESEYTKTYIAGKSSDDEDVEPTVTDTSADIVNGRFIHLIAGRGAIELKEGDIVTFEMKHPRNKNLRDLKCYSGILSATLKESDEVPFGGNYPIGKNLPEIQVTEFLKAICILTSTFPSQRFVGSTLQLADITSLWNSKSLAVDWTKKLIPSDAYNHPRQTDFSIEDYCQHNIYKWKEDETVYLEHNADMKIDNNTLEYTQEVCTLPFAASDGSRIPIYEWESVQYTFGHSTTTIQEATKYSACKDRITNVIKNSEGKAALAFNIDLQSIFDTKLAKLRAAIANPHQITERFNLSDLEILSFDETKPVYLAQYGAYFAVLEIKTTSNGYCEVTMIELT